jgi:hypothetical protein
VSVGISVGSSHSSSAANGSGGVGGQIGSGGGVAVSLCDDHEQCTDDDVPHCRHTWVSACGANPCEDGNPKTSDTPVFGGLCCRHKNPMSRTVSMFCPSVSAEDQCDAAHECNDAVQCTLDGMKSGQCAHQNACSTDFDRNVCDYY